MSMVPMMYRDWWDDWDTPLRRSRLMDQHFGSGVRRDDLMSSFWNAPVHHHSPPPSTIRSSYFRPWHRQRRDSGSTLNYDKDNFQVLLDVQQFTPNEITVKNTDKFIIVEAKHEERPDEHGFISRHFVRRYQIPSGINPNDITSSLSSDGILTVSAPLKSHLEPNYERVVPITQTGSSKTETVPKADDLRSDYAD